MSSIQTGLLISLSGIDGAGKSTLVQIIRAWLQQNGRDSHHVWCKFGEHPLSRLQILSALKQIKKVQASRLSPNGLGGEPNQGVALRSPTVLYGLYGKFLLGYHLYQLTCDIRRRLNRGQTVICDRYIFDTMVDLQQEFHYGPDKARAVFDGPRVPRPTHKFLLDLPEQIAFRRKSDTVSTQFLRERRRMYLALAQACGLTIIDATQPLPAISQVVIGELQAAAGDVGDENTSVLETKPAAGMQTQ